jgi:hypothetical protein
VHAICQRTSPFQQIRNAPLGPTTHCTGRQIVREVLVPGLTTKDGSPLAVEITYEIHEIDADWVSVIVDHAYDSAPTVFGAHSAAVGPLRDLLPDEYPLSEYPQDPRVARDKVVSMLHHHDLGGWVFTDLEYSRRNLRIELPSRISAIDDAELSYYFAVVREYFPFNASIRWDSENRCIRIRPVESCDD